MKQKKNMPNLFSSQAQLYAKYRPTYPVELYEFILQHLDQKQYAWDCGTGSGQVARFLANHFEKVYATDISQEQLNHAVKNKNIKYINTSAENSGLPSDYFNLITVAQAIHWFNFKRFYEEVNRTGLNGAILAVIGYGVVQANHQKIDPIINQLYSNAFGTYFGGCRKYIDNNYQTIPFPFEEIQAPSFEINQRWTLDELEGYFNSWSSIQKIKTEKGFNPVDDTMKNIKRNVSADKPLNVTFPVFLRLGKIFK